MKRKVILFSNHDKPRILINPSNIEELKSNPNAIVDPDLSKVKGVPSEYWLLVDGEIIAMALDQRKIVDAVIRSNDKQRIAVSNMNTEEYIKENKSKLHIYSAIVAVSVSASYYVSKYEVIDKLIKEIINVYQSI